MSKLVIKDITVNYNNDDSVISVLQKVNLEVKDKEFVAIVGPSGCGKTTLLKSVAGYIRPDQGKIQLGEKDITGQIGEVGYVFQNCVVFPWLTVWENVAFGVKRKIQDSEKIEKIVQHYLNAVSLRGQEDYYVNELSGGMRQRLAIAMVLATSPEILLMDEPFSSLDTQTKGLMQELIASIWEEDKKTVLFVTHDIEEAIFLADRIYVMGARPGTVEQCITVDLPRPRTSDIKLSNEFFTLKKHLTYLVRGEAIKSANVQLHSIRPNAFTIGVHAWPGNSPFYLAREWGWYADKGMEVELIDLEKKEDRLLSLISGEIDLFVATLDGAIKASQTNKGLKILAVLNQSHGGDGLLVRNGINNLHELKGKKIAVEKDWVSHFFLLYLLKKNNLASKNIKIINLKGSDIGAALISGQVDGAVTFEPWLTQAKNLAGAKLLASTNDYPVIYDVLMVKESVFEKREEEINLCLDMWFRAVESMAHNNENGVQAASHAFMISKNEVEQQLEKLRFVNREESRYLINESDDFSELKKEIEVILKEN